MAASSGAASSRRATPPTSRATGEDALWMAGAAPLRRDRARRDAARASTASRSAAAARQRRLGAGADADRARRGRGPRRRARRGRRRLPDQAVLVRRAARTAARARAARRRRAPGRARGRRPAARPGHPPGRGGATPRSQLSAKEFALLETFMRRPGQVLSRARPARARVGLRLREPLERRRRLRPLPAREDRPAVRRALDRDGARRGLPAARGRRR